MGEHYQINTNAPEHLLLFALLGFLYQNNQRETKMVQENIFHLLEKGTSILYFIEKIRSFLVMTSFFEKVSIIFSFLRVFTFLPTLMLYIYWHKPSSGTFECRSPTFQWKPSNSLQCQVYWMFSLWFFMPTITTRNLATTTAKAFSFLFGNHPTHLMPTIIEIEQQGFCLCFMPSW